jgi:hypothetical protein
MSAPMSAPAVENQAPAQSGADQTLSARRPGRARGTDLLPVIHLPDNERFGAYLTDSVRRISPYYEHAEITATTVELVDVHPLSRIVERARFRRARKLVRAMRLRGIVLFEPCLLRYRGERDYRLVLPPVVETTERHDGVMVVVDGVHRLAALSRAFPRRTEVSVILVSGPSLPRPAARPVNFSDITIEAGDVSPRKKFRRLQPRLFRPAGSTLRGDSFSFESVDSFLAAVRQAG